MVTAKSRPTGFVIVMVYRVQPASVQLSELRWALVGGWATSTDCLRDGLTFPRTQPPAATIIAVASTKGVSQFAFMRQSIAGDHEVRARRAGSGRARLAKIQAGASSGKAYSRAESILQRCKWLDVILRTATVLLG